MATKELLAPAYGLLILQVARLRGLFTWTLAQLLWLLQLWVRWLAVVDKASGTALQVDGLEYLLDFVSS